MKRCIAAGENWRIDWVATVTLIRAVGHVLRQVDKHDPPEGASFSDFIKPERDNALKEYALGVYAPSYILSEEGERILDEQESGFLLTEQPNTDFVDEALQWWEAALSAIESNASAATGSDI